MRPITRSIAALAAAALASLAGTALAQPAPVELKLATASPAGSPWAKQVERFAADVAAESNNTLKISPYFNSQLGTENDALAQLIRGRIDIGMFTLGSIALQVPEANVPAMYMYFDSIPQRACVLDKHLSEPFRGTVAQKGMEFLGWFEVGIGQIAGKKPITHPDQIKGLKMGVTTNKMVNQFWQTYGAIPVATPIAEATANIGTGLIDVYGTVAPFYVPSGLNKVAPVWSLVNYNTSPAALVVSKRVMDGLKPEHREALQRAAAKVPAETIRQEVAAVEKALIAKHKEAGGSVAEPTAEELAAWRKPMPAYHRAVVKELGANAEKLFDLMEKGKKACGA